MRMCDRGGGGGTIVEWRHSLDRPCERPFNAYRKINRRDEMTERWALIDAWTRRNHAAHLGIYTYKMQLDVSTTGSAMSRPYTQRDRSRCYDPGACLGPTSVSTCHVITWRLSPAIRRLILTHSESTLTMLLLSLLKQEAQLSQRGRAMLPVIDYFAKSLKTM